MCQWLLGDPVYAEVTNAKKCTNITLEKGKPKAMFTGFSKKAEENLRYYRISGASSMYGQLFCDSMTAFSLQMMKALFATKKLRCMILESIKCQNYGRKCLRNTSSPLTRTFTVLHHITVEHWRHMKQTNVS